MTLLNNMKQYIQKINLPLYLQITIGMIIGIIIGFVALSFSEGVGFVNDWIRPWGNLFIRLLQMIAVPLVFFSLLKGIMGVMDIGKFTRLWLRTLIIYISTTVVAVLLGLSLGLIVKPGSYLNKTEQTSLFDKYENVEKQYSNISQQNRAPLSFLNDLVPSNFIKAASENGKILLVIFFAIMISLAIILIPN